MQCTIFPSCHVYYNFNSWIACFLHRITEISLEMFNNPLFKSIFVLAASPFLVSAQHLIMHHREFYKMPNKSLLGNVMETKKVEDYFDCSFLCLEHGPFDCLSFNFGTVNDNGYYTCELSNSEGYLEPQKMQQRSSYDYYGTTSEVSSTHINRGKYETLF